MKKISMCVPDITEEEVSSVSSVIRSGVLSLGEKVKEFEHKLSDYSGARYLSAVSSGTSGLHLLMRYYGIGRGEIVIVPSFTFIATINSFVYEGATPVFVDVDIDTYCISKDSVLDYIEKKCSYDKEGLRDNLSGKRVRAIIGVDVFGHPFDYDAIKEICDKYGLILICDSAESIGSEYKGKKCGSYGDGGIFAFYPNKQIVTGEGVGRFS